MTESFPISAVQRLEGLMFKIGDFSKLCLVSVRMFRYYDELSLLKPEIVDNLLSIVTILQWHRLC